MPRRGVATYVRAVDERPEDELSQLRASASFALVAASLVHDFNNLLTPMLVLSSCLQREVDENSTAATLAAEINGAAALAAALMRDLLSLARAPEKSSVARVDVNEVVVARRRLIERLVGESVHVVLDLAWDVGEVEVDRGRLEHALFNLVANARDAMPAGGTLTLATRAEGDMVMLAVEDTGVGMNEEVRMRAFESFFTTKGGVGIGLASVARLARDGGGSVTHETEPAEGPAVALRLPRAPAIDEPAPVLRQIDVAAEPTGTGAILVADPDARVRRTVRLALEPRGYTVFEAATCERAVEIARERRTHVALVDPSLQPRTFVHSLRAASPELRVVFLTSAPPRQPTESPARLLPKAFTEDELLRAVRDALR